MQIRDREIVRSHPLSDEELVAVEAEIMAVHADVVEWAIKAYGDTQYRQFRRDFFAGNLGGLGMPKPVAARIEALKSLENKLVQHNVGMVRDMAAMYFRWNRHRMPGVELEDFYQEGYMAVVNCIYAYNGEQKFSTYLHWAVENAYKDLVRVDTPLSPISPAVIDTVQQIQAYLKDGTVTFSKAVEALGLDARTAVNAARAMAKVFNERRKTDDDDGKDRLDHVPIGDAEPSSEDARTELLMEAFRTANLTPSERDLYEGLMRDDFNGYQTRVAHERGVSRQAINQEFSRAKKKILARYETLTMDQSKAA